MLRKSVTALLLLSSVIMVLGLGGYSFADSLKLDESKLATVKVSEKLSETFFKSDGFVHQHQNPKLDAALSGLVQIHKTSTGKKQPYVESNQLRISGNRVHVQVITDKDRIGNVIQVFIDAGGEVTGTGVLNKVIQGWLPVDSLENVAAEVNVYFIRKPADLVLLEGASETEALDDMNAAVWHAAGAKGAGVNIAIIDGGFSGYSGLLGTDLPSSVTVKNFVDGQNDADVGSSTSSHGTACAEIIYDIAPDASLYLLKIATNVDLNEAKTWATANEIDVISTSMGWYTLTPGDGTGEFETIVQQARTAGITWCTAAGNDRENHWGGLYNDTDGDGYHEFFVSSTENQEVNYFGPGQVGIVYVIPAGKQLRAFLSWDDWTNVDQDYILQILIYSSGWQILAQSDNPQTGADGQTPTEFISAVTPMQTYYAIAIKRKSGTTGNANLRLFCPKFYRFDEIVHERSLANLADSPSAITVAALDVSPPYPQESYSSEGPVCGPGGTITSALFVKPDISAYANVSTQSYGAEVFNGTSAATPHVAGAAALIKSAHPDFTPDDIQDELEDNAADMGAAGDDTVFGWGRLLLGDAPAVACTGDYDTDNDVDGSDLSTLANDPSKLADLEDFSGNFGKVCG